MYRATIGLGGGGRYKAICMQPPIGCLSVFSLTKSGVVGRAISRAHVTARGVSFCMYFAVGEAGCKVVVMVFSRRLVFP